MSSIKELERKLAQADSRAKAWGIDDRLRQKREAEVAALEIELELALARANGTLAGRRSRW